MPVADMGGEPGAAVIQGGQSLEWGKSGDEAVMPHPRGRLRCNRGYAPLAVSSIRSCVAGYLGEEA